MEYIYIYIYHQELAFTSIETERTERQTDRQTDRQKETNLVETAFHFVSLLSVHDQPN
jgi:hypothetical protein